MKCLRKLADVFLKLSNFSAKLADVFLRTILRILKANLLSLYSFWLTLIIVCGMKNIIKLLIRLVCMVCLTFMAVHTACAQSDEFATWTGFK